MTQWKRMAAALLVALPLLVGCGGESSGESTVPVSEEAAASLESKLATATASQEQQVSVTLTQEEVTSYWRLRVRESPLQEPQIVFADGKITLTGRATAGVTQNFRVVAAPYVENGILQFDFQEAKFGPLPLPAEMLSVVNDQLRDALTGNTMGRLESVTVGAGTLTITGERAGAG